MRATYLRTEWVGHPTQQYAEKEIVSSWCHEKFGSPVDYVQGVAAVPAWKIINLDEKEFNEARPIKWGGLPTKTEKIHIQIGKKFYRGPPYTTVLELDVTDKKKVGPETVTINKQEYEYLIKQSKATQ